MKNNRENQQAHAATVWGKLCLSSSIIVEFVADYNTNSSSLANNQSFHQIWHKFMHYFLGYIVGQTFA